MSCQRRVGLYLMLTVLALSPGVNELNFFSGRQEVDAKKASYVRL